MAQVNPAAPAQWFKIYEQGMQINTVCLTNQRKGGAAVVMGVLHLSYFIQRLLH